MEGSRAVGKDTGCTVLTKCASCAKMQVGNSRCSRCHQEYYCNRECQIEHWKEHKKACVDPSKVVGSRAKDVRNGPAVLAAACGAPDCRNLGDKLSKCSGCNVRRYCSKDCQKADWPIHKLICGKAVGTEDPNLSNLRAWDRAHLGGAILLAIRLLADRASLSTNFSLSEWSAVSQKYTAVFQHEPTNQKTIKRETRLIFRKFGVEEIDLLFNAERAKTLREMLNKRKPAVLISYAVGNLDKGITAVHNFVHHFDPIRNLPSLDECVGRVCFDPY